MVSAQKDVALKACLEIQLTKGRNRFLTLWWEKKGNSSSSKILRGTKAPKTVYEVKFLFWVYKLKSPLTFCGIYSSCSSAASQMVMTVSSLTLSSGSWHLWSSWAESMNKTLKLLRARNWVYSHVEFKDKWNFKYHNIWPNTYCKLFRWHCSLLWLSKLKASIRPINLLYYTVFNISLFFFKGGLEVGWCHR